METALKSFSMISFLLFMCISTTGYAQPCSISDIKVTTTQTGRSAEGAPEWLVSVSNACHCPQSNVYLKCRGFSSYEVLNPQVLKVEGDNCLINGGKKVVQGVPVTFKFAFVIPFDLVPLKSSVAC